MKGIPDIKILKGIWSKFNIVIILPLVIIFLAQAYIFCTPVFVAREKTVTVGSESAAETILESLSREFQERIEATQNKGCHGATLDCGHRENCGFGCQVHHRIGCLVISLALDIPLIHNLTMWPYKEPWNEVFHHIGSNCRVTGATLKWDWKKSDRDGRFRNFDLRKGFPLWKEMIGKIEKLHPNPFLWVVGQFVKYALKPSETFEKKLEEWKKEIQLEEWKNSSVIGIHVRRTDKPSDGLHFHTWHELPEYIEKAESFFATLEQNSTLSLQRKLFVMSDDNKIFPDAKKTYAWWDVRGFNSTKNHLDYHPWSDGGHGSGWEVFRDVFLLSECDHVICGFSSHICGLALEMMAGKSDEDPTKRINPMERGYGYWILEGEIPQRLIPYEKVQDLQRLINLTLIIGNEARNYFLFKN